MKRVTFKEFHDEIAPKFRGRNNILQKAVWKKIKNYFDAQPTESMTEKFNFLLGKVKEYIELDIQNDGKFVNCDFDKDDKENLLGNFLNGHGSAAKSVAFHYYFQCKKEYSDLIKKINTIAFDKLKISDIFKRPFIDIEDNEGVNVIKYAAEELNEREIQFDDQVNSTSKIELKRNLIEEFINTALEDYEESQIEGEFDDFVNSENSGTWLLTSGPGMGKTTLMASLMRRRYQEFSTIPYFFIQPLQTMLDKRLDKIGNTPLDFYDFVFGRLGAIYADAVSVDMNPPIKNGDSLGSVFFGLSEQGFIGKENPLFLILDGLDEIGDGNAGNDVLGLPKLLPDGVYIAYSTRIKTSSELELETLKAEFPSYDKLTCLGWGVGGKLHRRTMVQYVKRICEKNAYITKHLNLPKHKTSEKLLREFVKFRCRSAGYNGMILRCLFYEKTYWENGGTGAELTKSLSDYYQKHLDRMGRQMMDKAGLNTTYCFSLENEISRKNFMRIAVAPDEIEKAEYVEASLDEWLRQGLIVERLSDGIKWLAVYHRTYREFLQKAVNRLSDSQFVVPALQNLRRHVSLSDLTLENYGESGNKIEHKCEWLKLWLKLSVRSENIKSLEDCLYKIQTWQFAAGSPDHLPSILTHIASVVPRNDTAKAQYEIMFTNLSNLLKGWCSSQLLIQSDNEAPYAFADVIQIIGRSGYTGNPNTILFSDIVGRLFEKDKS